MIDLDAAEIAALAGRVVAERNYLVVWARDRDTDVIAPVALWHEAHDCTAEVVDALTGTVTEYQFLGGAILSIGDVERVSDVTVRTLDIELSALDPLANALVRGTDARIAPMQLYRGYHDPDTLELLAPAKPTFVGWVDEAPIVTGKEGDVASITLRCASHTRELRRINPEVRSDESQQKRSPGDRKYRYVATIGLRDVAWGEIRQRPSAGNAGQSGAGVSRAGGDGMVPDSGGR